MYALPDSNITSSNLNKPPPPLGGTTSATSTAMVPPASLVATITSSSGPSGDNISQSAPPTATPLTATTTLLRNLFSMPLATLAASAATYGFGSQKLPVDGITLPPRGTNKLRTALEAELIYSEVLASAPPIVVPESTINPPPPTTTPGPVNSAAQVVHFSASASSADAQAFNAVVHPSTPTVTTAAASVSSATSLSTSALHHYLSTTSQFPSAAALSAVSAASVATRQRAQLAIAAMLHINNCLEREEAEAEDRRQQEEDDKKERLSTTLPQADEVSSAEDNNDVLYRDNTIGAILVDDDTPSLRLLTSGSATTYGSRLVALLAATPNNISYLITQQCTELASLVFRTMTTVVNFLIPAAVGKGGGKGVVLLYRKWLCDVFRYLTDDGEETMGLYSKILEHYNSGNPMAPKHHHHPNNNENSISGSGGACESSASTSNHGQALFSQGMFQSPFNALHITQKTDFADVEGELLEGHIVCSGAPFDTTASHNLLPPQPQSAQQGYQTMTGNYKATPINAVSRLLDVTGSWKATVKPLNLLTSSHASHPPQHSLAPHGLSGSFSNMSINPARRSITPSAAPTAAHQQRRQSITSSGVSMAHESVASPGSAARLTPPTGNISGQNTMALLAHTLPAGTTRATMELLGVPNTQLTSIGEEEVSHSESISLQKSSANNLRAFNSVSGKSSPPNLRHAPRTPPPTAPLPAPPVEAMLGTEHHYTSPYGTFYVHHNEGTPAATRMLFALSLPTGSKDRSAISIAPASRLTTEALVLGSPATEHLRGPIVGLHPSPQFQSVMASNNNSSISQPAPSAALHLHSYRHLNIRTRSDVSKAYLTVLADAESSLHPAHPVRASLVNNTADHMAAGGDFKGALKLIRGYMEEVAAEAAVAVGGGSGGQAPSVVKVISVEGGSTRSTTTVASAVASAASGTILLKDSSSTNTVKGSPKTPSSGGLSSSLAGVQTGSGGVTGASTGDGQNANNAATTPSAPENVVFVVSGGAAPLPTQGNPLQMGQSTTTTTPAPIKKGFTTSSASRGAGATASVGSLPSHTLPGSVLAASPMPSNSLASSHGGGGIVPPASLCLSAAAAGITDTELEETHFVLRMLQQAAAQLSTIVGAVPNKATSLAAIAQQPPAVVARPF